MAFFVYIASGAGCMNAFGDLGTAKSVPDPAYVLGVALTVGFAITVLVYATAHVSGGQINCAVTFALCLSGELSWIQGFCNFISQMLGSLVGAGFLLLATNGDSDGLTPRDFTGSLGSNGVNPRYSVANCFVGETIMTFLLAYVVFETAVNKKSVADNNAPIAIGLTVFISHMVLIPQTGCSINPTRSFGPAVVAYAEGNQSALDNHWIFWVAPLLGAALAAGLRGYHIVHYVNPKKDDDAGRGTVVFEDTQQSLETANNQRAFAPGSRTGLESANNQRAFDPGHN